GRAGRPVRAVRVVLWVQAAPPARSSPPAAADGGRLAQEVARRRRDRGGALTEARRGGTPRPPARAAQRHPGQRALTPHADRRGRAGHPWVYRGEIADLAGAWSAAEAVDVVDAGGRFLGRGYYNPRTSLACRIATRLDESIDRAFVRRRLEAALEYRRAAGL